MNQSPPIMLNPQRRYVGTSVLRTEDARFLTGRGRYTDDIHLNGMLHAAFLRSPFAFANIKSIDTSAALAMPGVHAVLLQEDFDAKSQQIVTTLERDDVKTLSRSPLNSERALFVGQPVAMVLASSRYIAEDAAEAIEVDWDILDPVVDAEKALEDDAPVLWPELDGNSYAEIEYANGPVEQAFAEADHVFTNRFHHLRCTSAPLETRGLVADYDSTTGDMTVWASSQFPHFLRTYLAGILQFPESQLRVISDSVGGGFGQKATLFEEDVLVPAASLIVGRPVKWIEDRYENIAAASQSKEVICELEAAVDSDGTFKAFRGRFINCGGAWPAHATTSLLDGLAAASLLPGVYDIDAVAYKVEDALTNRCPLGAYRGVGWTPGHSAREMLIDEIARELDIDPVELRLKNIIPEEPFTSITGMNYDGGSYKQSVRRVMEMMDYDAQRERQKRLLEEGRLLGIGITPWVEPTAWGSEIARKNGMPFDYYDSATVTIEPDGSVLVTNGCHNHGQGHETVFAQLAADVLDVPIESVRVVQNDTATSAYGAGTGASRSAVIAGGSIMRAGTEVRKNLLALAGDAMEVAAEDLEIVEGNIRVKGNPSQSMTIQEVAGYAYFGGKTKPSPVAEGLSATRGYDPPETYSNGACGTIVEIDPETGHCEIESFYICEDCGTILNPMVVDGQLQGGAAQGIGIAVLEGIHYDESGQLLTGSLMDYLYPTTTEIPPMELSHIETPSPVTEGGIKGMGESTTLAGAAGVLSAIGDAIAQIGPVSITTSPLGPSEIKDLIKKAKEAAPKAA